jgi:hypothetical protein
MGVSRHPSLFAPKKARVKNVAVRCGPRQKKPVDIRPGRVHQVHGRQNDQKRQYVGRPFIERNGASKMMAVVRAKNKKIGREHLHDGPRTTNAVTFEWLGGNHGEGVDQSGDPRLLVVSCCGDNSWERALSCWLLRPHSPGNPRLGGLGGRRPPRHFQPHGPIRFGVAFVRAR